MVKPSGKTWFPPVLMPAGTLAGYDSRSCERLLIRESKTVTHLSAQRSEQDALALSPVPGIVMPDLRGMKRPEPLFFSESLMKQQDLPTA
jgi:hypothetical protein